MKHLILLLSMATLLSGCSLTTPKDTGKANMLALQSVEVENKRRTRRHLIVNHPATPSELDTYRIAVQLDEGKRDYVASARWAEFLPNIIQASLVDTLQDSKLFARVSSDQAASDSRYRLDSEILHFEVNYRSGQPIAVNIEISFTLKNLRTLRTVKQFTLTHSAISDEMDALPINNAFQKAYGDLQEALVKKLAKTL